MNLHIVPMDWKQARGFVQMWHRHLKPPRGMKFCIGVADTAKILRGVAIVGRPVARNNQDGQTLEVTRTATDGTCNANSMLYGAAWRGAKALGYTRLITYNQAGESGASLKAAGFRVVAERPAHPGWDRPSRPRDLNGSEGIPRTLWEVADESSAPAVQETKAVPDA